MFYRNSTCFQQTEGREYTNYFNCFFVRYIKNLSSQVITHVPVLTLLAGLLLPQVSIILPYPPDTTPLPHSQAPLFKDILLPHTAKELLLRPIKGQLPHLPGAHLPPTPHTLPLHLRGREALRGTDLLGETRQGTIVTGLHSLMTGATKGGTVGMKNSASESVLFVCKLHFETGFSNCGILCTHSSG